MVLTVPNDLVTHGLFRYVPDPRVGRPYSVQEPQSRRGLNMKTGVPPLNLTLPTINFNTAYVSPRRLEEERRKTMPQRWVGSKRGFLRTSTAVRRIWDHAPHHEAGPVTTHRLYSRAVPAALRVGSAPQNRPLIIHPRPISSSSSSSSSSPSSSTRAIGAPKDHGRGWVSSRTSNRALFDASARPHAPSVLKRNLFSASRMPNKAFKQRDSFGDYISAGSDPLHEREAREREWARKLGREARAGKWVSAGRSKKMRTQPTVVV